MLHIIAGNARQAHNYAFDNKISIQDYRFVYSSEHLQGIEGDYIKIGTWYNHRDIRNITKLIHSNHRLKEVK
jgi:hypothetical protein